MMSKRPFFWIALALLSGGALYFAIANFSGAFPIVSIELKMDRAAALRSARELASRNHWGPEGAFRQAASFGVDDTVQTFVELAGGGKDAFRTMLDRGLYAAYTWRVRDFREGETRETTVRFSPGGVPYGFVEKLPETAPGPGLSEADARRIAEAEAARAWHVDFAAYVPVEASKEVKPGGRVDHTFVYERPNERLGEGRYRLRLAVSGDRLTELTHFVKVPEAFARHYEEMRSANNAIAFGALMAAIVLYLLGGAGFGLFTLLRRRWVLWRPALILGAVIALTQALDVLNSWPLAWMRYDTALPGSTFMLQRVGAVVATFFITTFYLTISFMAAEGLSRRAFPHQPQLWRLWSRDGAATLQVLGRTAGGYLYTGIEFAYIVAFYLIASRLWGWWSPSDSLVQPDVLATYLPWLSAVAPSLHAGVWEESFFRAIPIAGAALIGDRLGGRRAWIFAALVLQAVVFGGGHANYASEPAYARLVELILPAFIWGIIYLCFGLLPTIITHYVFDLSLFAIPLFTSSAAHARVDQLMVIACGLVPLGVVLVARARARSWGTLGESLLNRGWAPAPARPVEPPAEPESVPVESGPAFTPGRVRIAMALGLAALALWAFSGRHSDAPRFSIGRAEARAAALRALAAQGFEPSARWTPQVSVETEIGAQNQFVWRTAGPEAYRALLGTYVPAPHWRVRVVTFTGDVVERAEEWEVEVAGDGTVGRIHHSLPQRRPGPALEEDAARAIAGQALRDRFHADPLALREVSAVSSQLPARRDWTFTYADTAAHVLKTGEPRLSVEIAGDRVADARRYVFVPEEWDRKYRGEQSLSGILGAARGVLVVLIALTGVVFAILFWSRRAFPARVAGVTFGVLTVVSLILIANNWSAVEARFSTAQPLELQRTVALVAGLLGRLIFAAGGALLVGLAHARVRAATHARSGAPIALGVATGLVVAGLVRLLWMAGRAGAPAWPDYLGAQTVFPVLREGLAPVNSVLMRSAIVMLGFATVHHWTRGWTRNRIAFGGVLFLFGALVGQLGNGSTPLLWLEQALISGAVLLALYVLVFRHDLRLVPVAAGVLSALAALRATLLDAYPGAIPGGLIGVPVALAVAWLWYRALSADGRREAEPPAA